MNCHANPLWQATPLWSWGRLGNGAKITNLHNVTIAGTLRNRWRKKCTAVYIYFFNFIGRAGPDFSLFKACGGSDWRLALSFFNYKYQYRLKASPWCLGFYISSREKVKWLTWVSCWDIHVLGTYLIGIISKEQNQISKIWTLWYND